jgi:hypothetical protein
MCSLMDAVLGGHEVSCVGTLGSPLVWGIGLADSRVRAGVLICCDLQPRAEFEWGCDASRCHYRAEACNNSGRAGAVARTEGGVLFVTFRSVPGACHLPLDFGES